MRFLIILFLLFQSNFLNAFELNGEIIQGALIVGKEQADKSIYVNNQKIKLSKNGIFVFGINYNQVGNVVIESVDKNIQYVAACHEFTGALTTTGDITAFFSDRRLKTNVCVITDAVTKVRALTGIRYTPNQLAEQLGFATDESIVGLFADELEAVLPEAVKLAPFDSDENGDSKSGENYKTIQYEKVVPLLVEAIKELSREFEEFKKKFS